VILRPLERDMATGEWHDGLLMERVEPPPATGGAS
jgi:hypothetical protein